MASIRLINQGTVNKNIVEIGNISLYFSYETIVAFLTPRFGLVCRVNDWSSTTGKFLNDIQPDKSKRIESAEFEKQIAKLLKKIKV